MTDACFDIPSIQLATGTNPPLERMGKGSHGPAVNVIIEFLNVWAVSRGYADPGLIADDYDDQCVEWMRRYKGQYGLGGSGSLTPETVRHITRHDGIEIVARMRDQRPRQITAFRQEDESVWYWAPDTAASMARGSVVDQLRDLDGGV